MNSFNEVWKYLCTEVNPKRISHYYMESSKLESKCFWDGVLTALEVEKRISSEDADKIWKEITG